jgi:hypothetical protein
VPPNSVWKRYGRYLGIAFQIADDILDITGREETTGKSLGTDLQQQKPTLPLIRLLETAEPVVRQQVLQLATSETETRMKSSAACSIGPERWIMPSSRPTATPPAPPGNSITYPHRDSRPPPPPDPVRRPPPGRPAGSTT